MRPVTNFFSNQTLVEKNLATSVLYDHIFRGFNDNARFFRIGCRSIIPDVGKSRQQIQLDRILPSLKF
jgi:hypothetical protein